jgi:Glyoxalase-like domain
MPVLPVPTIDHVVVNVRDRLDEAVETYRRLGFTMTPRGYHSLGSMNHLAIFGTDYLELIAAQPGDARRTDILDWPLGLNGLVFATDDSAAVYAALEAAGVPIEPPLEFSRPVALSAGGERDARFRTVRLKPGVIDAGRVYFCHHFTRDLVWRDEWRHHPNGVTGVIRVIIAADDPSALGAVFGRMFGADAVQAGAAGCSLTVGLSRVDIVPVDALRAEFGTAAPDGGGRSQFMAALSLRTRSLDAAATVLRAGGVAARREPERVVVAAADAFGVTLEFRP